MLPGLVKILAHTVNTGDYKTGKGSFKKTSLHLCDPGWEWQLTGEVIGFYKTKLRTTQRLSIISTLAAKLSVCHLTIEE